MRSRRKTLSSLNIFEVANWIQKGVSAFADGL
jgi:hypothetical protein